MTSRTPLILLIEDEAGFRRVYRDSLEHAGYRVVEAVDGEAGWEAAQAEEPDLILLDVVMPKLNGFDLLERLRATPQHAATPIVIMSVLGEPGDMDTGMSLGADDYIVKGSVSTTDLVAKVRERLGKPATAATKQKR
jgi:DNA-binding response OmpR family regulator